MKNKRKLIGFIAIAAIIAIALTACPPPDDTHSHSYGNWKSNTTQHWKECSCGEEYGRANHTFYEDVCSVCNYEKGSTPGTAPTVTTTSLTGGTVGTAYNQTLTATGDAPITWTVETGTLPNGLTLSTEGVISGNPTTANTFNFTVKATNAVSSDTKALSIVIGSGGGDPSGTYIITGSGTQFTATKGGATVGTANQTIQTVINTIETDANGANSTIQFGNGTSVLDIGEARIMLNGTWGTITLTGKITSSVVNTIYPTNVSLNISADIECTADTKRAIMSEGTGTITINSGTIDNITNRGTLIINGGTIGAINNSSGTVVVNDGVISSSSDITISNRTTIGGSTGIGTVTINGGLVETTGTTSSDYAIRNQETGNTVNITGGTVKASGSAYAVYNSNGGTVTIEPSATIIGNTYGVESGTPATYVITGSGTAFTATKNSATVGTANQPIQTVIDAIRTDANGANCTIQFGNLTETLDFGEGATRPGGSSTSGVRFDGWETWGTVTLTGKITSIASYTISISRDLAGAISVISTANIGNTKSGGGYAIFNGGGSGTGSLTINGGTVSGTAGGVNRAITNSATLIINNGTIGGISNSGQTGNLTINGGTVSSASGSAVGNSVGTVTITGGTVSSTGYSTCVTNGENGTLTITGGTVSGPTPAVWNFSGTVTIHDPPAIITGGTSGTINWVPPK